MFLEINVATGFKSIMMAFFFSLRVHDSHTLTGRTLHAITYGRTSHCIPLESLIDENFVA